MMNVCLESYALFRPTLCPRLNPDRYNGDFLWALVAAMAMVAAALFAVASKAELRFIAVKSFVLSATVDAVTAHLSWLSGWVGGIMTQIYAQEGRAARAP